MPGIVSKYTSLVKNANSIWLNGKPLKKDLELGYITAEHCKLYYQ